MVSPVILSDGYTYEESAIKEWLDRGKQVSSNMTCCEAHTTNMLQYWSTPNLSVLCRSAP